MTERELKSLSKKQIISLLTQQDNALEKLAKELEKAKLEHEQTKNELGQTAAELSAAKQQVVELGASPTLLSNIVKAANDAADKYVADAEKAIEQRKEKLLELEREAESKIKTVEERACLAISDVCSVLDKHIQSIHTLYAQFHTNLRNAGMARFLPAEKQEGSPIPGIQIEPASEEPQDENSDTAKTGGDKIGDSYAESGYNFFYTT